MMDWFDRLIKARATDWYFAPLEEGELVAANKVYVNVFLRSMRIRDVRKGLKRFAGAVHSYIELGQLGTGAAAFHTFTVPDELKKVSRRRLDRVVVSSQRLLGPVPYRGGDISLDVALFAVETSDLVDDYLGILTDLANAAGVGYVNAALPFVKPIENGIQRLLDGSGPASLEIGLSKDLEAPRQGSYVVMRGPADELTRTQLTHDAEFKLARADKQKLDYPYLTFEVTAAPIRDDWFQIDELRRAYSTLQDVARARNVGAAKEQFAVFRSATLTSPDLLHQDAQRIVATVERELENTLPTTTTSRDVNAVQLPELETLQPFVG